MADTRLRLWQQHARSLGRRDPRLKSLIAAVGKPQIEFQSDPFQSLCEAILSQQLASSAAQAIIARVAKLQPPFPKPGFFDKPRASVLKAGVSLRKREYLKCLSNRWADKIWKEGWDKLEDSILIERLTEVKGIGVWTAQMFLIFCLGRPNVLPVDDFGVRKALALFLKLPNLPTPKEVAQLVPHWEGSYSVASWYLWRSLDEKLLH